MAIDGNDMAAKRQRRERKVQFTQDCSSQSCLISLVHEFILLSSLFSSLKIHALNEYFNIVLDFQEEGGINY